MAKIRDKNRPIKGKIRSQESGVRSQGSGVRGQGPGARIVLRQHPLHFTLHPSRNQPKWSHQQITAIQLTFAYIFKAAPALVK